MMKYFSRIITSLLLFSFFISCAQDLEPVEEIQRFIEQQNEYFKDENKSPLTTADRKSFKSLDYYDIDLDYRVEAKFIKVVSPRIISVNTSAGREKKFVEYAQLSFLLKGKKYSLYAYQIYNPKKAFQGGSDELFIMFNDKTNGDTTYGGGRYMDVMVPNNDKLTLDFNQTYNPYCAYSTGWACPIPPVENNLDVRIEAGIKAYHKH